MYIYISISGECLNRLLRSSLSLLPRSLLPAVSSHLVLSGRHPRSLIVFCLLRLVISPISNPFDLRVHVPSDLICLNDVWILNDETFSLKNFLLQVFNNLKFFSFYVYSPTRLIITTRLISTKKKKNDRHGLQFRLRLFELFD